MSNNYIYLLFIYLFVCIRHTQVHRTVRDTQTDRQTETNKQNKRKDMQAK